MGQGLWRTDGGTSLPHAGLTIFGTRCLDVDPGADGCISLLQVPGSFYVGNLCALKHNARHSATSDGCLGAGEEQVQIAVMLRTDVFRAARTRTLNATPGPAELFHIVNEQTAKHVSQEPFRLPGLDAVLAEAPAPPVRL